MSTSPRRGRTSIGGPAGASRSASGGGKSVPAVLSTRLTRTELAVLAASLRDLGRRLDRFRDRLNTLEAAVQSLPRTTSRSSRESRSSKRSRSS
jgi:hypothetical protein